MENSSCCFRLAGATSSSASLGCDCKCHNVVYSEQVKELGARSRSRGEMSGGRRGNVISVFLLVARAQTFCFVVTSEPMQVFGASSRSRLKRAEGAEQDYLLACS